MNNNWCKIISYNGTQVLVTKEYIEGASKPFAVRFRWELIEGATVMADVSAYTPLERDELFDLDDYRAFLGDIMPDVERVISEAMQHEG